VSETVESDYLKELKDFLNSKPKEVSVVVMPDFFIDRLVNINMSVSDFSERLGSVLERKGGSLDGINQTELRGGNAINTASALAALGARATPIVATDKLGSKLIRSYLAEYQIEFSHVKIVNKPSITTALEFDTQAGKANVMLRDIGSLANFGPHYLNADDFEAIDNADYVCVFNWAGTRRFGTELAQRVFQRVRMKGKGRTYCDTADPRPNEGKIPNLIKVLKSRNLDMLSVNESEASCYASQLGARMEKRFESFSFENLAKESARFLAEHLSARVDLHTTRFSASFTKKAESLVPAFKVPVLRATGAGDAWNAGNILGDANGLSDHCRLALANSAAAYYVSSAKGEHPTRKQLARFCERVEHKLEP